MKCGASDRAYRALREEILDGVLAPGTALAEVEQANRLGVSLTPLSRSTRPSRGRRARHGRVAARTAGERTLAGEHHRRSTNCAKALEKQAARLAAMRRDPERFEGLRSRLQLSPSQLASGDKGGLATTTRRSTRSTPNSTPRSPTPCSSAPCATPACTRLVCGGSHASIPSDFVPRHPSTCSSSRRSSPATRRSRPTPLTCTCT